MVAFPLYTGIKNESFGGASVLADISLALMLGRTSEKVRVERVYMGALEESVRVLIACALEKSP